MIFSKDCTAERSCDLLPGQQITIVRQDGAKIPATVTDVSEGGFGFSASDTPHVGESIIVRAGRCPEFLSQVRWARDSRAGAQYGELYVTSAP